MARFNGNDLVLAIGSSSGSEVRFAHAQSSTISFANALIDATTKDSGSWEEMISGRRSFTISTDGLADFDDVTGATSTEGFSDLAVAGTLINFQFTRTAASTGDFEGYSGTAYIESFEISAASDELTTYSVSLKGTGALTKVVMS